MNYTYKNKTGSLSYLCREFGFSYFTISNRIRKGMTVKEAFENPIRENKIYTYQDKTGSLNYLCKEFDKKYITIAKRIERGMSFEDAFNKPIKQINK